MAGLTDAKRVDAQAGYETFQNLFGCMLGGAHIVNECLGVMDSIMTNDFEKFILDEEMLGRILRFMEGVSRDVEELAEEAIRSVGPGGTYLMQPETIARCRSAWRPSVATWESYERWEALGAQDVAERAEQAWKERLSAAPETLLDPAVEEELSRFVEERGAAYR